MPFRELSIEGNVGFGMDVTNTCNASCAACFYLDEPANRISEKPLFMRAEDFQTAVDKARDANFRELYLLGGEPAIHPQITQMLDYASRFEFSPLILVTNGLKLADEDFCRRVADAGAMVAVQRHVMQDGKDAEYVQDILMGRKGTLPLANKAFENIEKHFPANRIAVQCCITRPAVEGGHLYDVFRYCKEKGYEHVIECTKSSSRFLRGNPLDVSIEELARVYEELARIDSGFSDKDREHFYEFTKTRKPSPQAYRKVCHMPETGVHCLVNGDIVPCVGQPYKLGNVFTDGLLEILSGPEREFFQKPAGRVEGSCKKCDYLQECTAGCRGEAYAATGCFSASSPYCPSNPKIETLHDLVPGNCSGCLMESSKSCSLPGEVNVYTKRDGLTILRR